MLRSLFAVGLALANAACGTLFSGVHQDVHIRASPPDAEVTFYALSGEKVVGPKAANDGPIRTPRPKHGIPHLSVATRTGYCPAYQMTKVENTPGFLAEIPLLTIPLINLIGMVVMQIDMSTGGCCMIVPLEVVLEPEEKCP